tara:strand:+ start:11755 stop:12879 length:1125 start_codon:yes stop_codon:yes gene_type:complete
MKNVLKNVVTQLPCGEHMGRFASKFAASWRRRSTTTVRLQDLDADALLQVLEGPRGKPFEVSTVRVESSSWCNLKCAGCPRTLAVEQDAWFNKHTSLEEYKLLFPHMPYSENLDLHDVGEPTLNPDLPEIVSFARQTGKFRNIYFISNAMGRTPEYFSNLFAQGLSHITISVDSLDQEIASIARFGTKVEKLRTKLEHLILNHPGQVRVNTVLSSVNIDDIHNTLAFTNDLAGRSGRRLRHSIALFDDFAGKGLTERKVDGDPVQRTREEARAWPTRYPHLLLIAPFVGGNQGEAPAPATRLCRRPWGALTVDVNGFLLPCGRVHDPAAMLFANLRERPFEDILRQPDMIEFFREYAVKSPDFCAGCGNDVNRD